MLHRANTISAFGSGNSAENEHCSRWRTNMGSANIPSTGILSYLLNAAKHEHCCCWEQTWVQLTSLPLGYYPICSMQQKSWTKCTHKLSWCERISLFTVKTTIKSCTHRTLVRISNRNGLLTLHIWSMSESSIITNRTQSFAFETSWSEISRSMQTPIV